MRPAQAALAAALREHAIREGEFTLSSGRTSNWYLDGRQVTFRGECVDIVGDAVVEALGIDGMPTFDAVGGLELGAVPVAIAIARTTGARSFAVRKEPKGHGVGGRMAGPVDPADRVLVVEDTATTGASLLKAVDAITEFGCEIVAASLLLDRGCEIVAASLLLDRGGELGDVLAARGIRYVPVLTAPDLGYEFGS